MGVVHTEAERPRVLYQNDVEPMTHDRQRSSDEPFLVAGICCENDRQSVNQLRNRLGASDWKEVMIENPFLHVADDPVSHVAVYLQRLVINDVNLASFRQVTTFGLRFFQLDK